MGKLAKTDPIDTAVISGRHAVVRTALHMDALIAACRNPLLKAFRDQFVADEKSKLAAVVADTCEVLVILNSILKHGRPWQPITA